MHQLLAKKIVERCRQREKAGDHPPEPAPSVEMLEDCILELARQIDRLETQQPEASRSAARAAEPEILSAENVSAMRDFWRDTNSDGAQVVALCDSHEMLRREARQRFVSSTIAEILSPAEVKELKRRANNERVGFDSLDIDALCDSHEDLRRESERLRAEVAAGREACRLAVEAGMQISQDLIAAREDTKRLERQNGDWEAVASLAVTKHKNAEAETARLRAVRPGIEKLLAECGFSTPGLLRILDPIFGEGPADYGKEDAPKKHADCVALMCGKIDCRRPGPCYIAARSPSTPDTPEKHE